MADRLDQAPDQLRDIADDIEQDHPLSASILRLIAGDVFKVQIDKHRRAGQDAVMASATEPARRSVVSLQQEARAIWGSSYRMNGHEVAVAATVTLGDFCRVVRDEHETGIGDGDRPVQHREIGNLIVSAIRWADDLGLDLDRCLADALSAQRKYVKRREPSNEPCRDMAAASPPGAETHG